MKRISLFFVFVLVVLQLVAQSNRYAETSILSSGDWYKIQVEQTGIHKITYEQLVDMGLKNPANVSIFGYGGAQLAESFSAPYIDDLPQLSIHIEKGSDGVFNSGDYILFYAQGPIKWTYNSKQNLFVHEVNAYSNYGYYFITSDYPTQKIIGEARKSNSTVEEVTSFNDFYLYEKDEVNLLNSGRVYLCDVFNNSQLTRNYTVKIPNILLESSWLSLSAAHTAVAEANMGIYVNNKLLGTPAFAKKPSNGVVATGINVKYEFVPTDSNSINVKLTYSMASATAYLDYFTLNIKRKLQKTTGESLAFRFLDNIGASDSYTYRLSNVTKNVQIWNVTDQQNVVKMPVTFSGNDLTFGDNKLELREYVAVDIKSDKFLQPKNLGKISNQNLHALGQADMVIIAHPDFVEAANRLAALHSEYDGLTTHIVVPEVVYNEFSSGTPDATAYRRFVKMFYDRAKEVGNAPKYLLLFGDGSFDNRQILTANTKDNIYRLLTYQAKESFDDIKSYVTDDYFGLLDDSDGANLLINSLDVAVGRIPSYTVEQANGVVDKLERYLKNEDFGVWKNQAVFMADDGDDNVHVEGADSACSVFERLNPDVLTRKLYLDSYTQEVTAVGEFYPTLKKEFFDYINNGVLLVNYMGHSGYNNWTNEQILSVADIDLMYNQRLPLFITMSCSFSRFDDFKVSGGEAMMLNGKGGALALISAARTVYAQPNLSLNVELNKLLLATNNETGRINTIGEAYRLAKNKRAYNNDSNRLPFILLGDPAIRLAVPQTHSASIDSINGRDVTSAVDTVGALGRVVLGGSICSLGDSVVDKTFNGYVHVTIFDKEEKIKTLCNDFKESDKDKNSKPFVYTYRANPLYVGQVEVVDGRFKVEFIVPKDIKYNFGAGRIVMYAVDEQQGFEANGHTSNIIIGGEARDAVIETDGPELKIYLNTPYFKNGDEVDANPLFVAELQDLSGINTIGFGIGHDIILKLDDDIKQEYVLNNYYKSDLGSYTSGVVTYQLSDLAPGKHKLFFRAWDLQNNSVSAELEFEVVKDLKMSIHDMYVYPNPVRDIANIVIEHDKPLAPIDVYMYVYDLSGHLIHQENMNLVTDASSKINLNWSVNSFVSDGLYYVKAVLVDDKKRKTIKSTKIFVYKQ
ncbi:MAG: type IX secretion system sortase PorU [Paludibacteraceae bacterium]|nr:type IX secretion system sortase PorU [Paludibacteraceae bacterium]